MSRCTAAISVEGCTIGETAKRLDMSEAAVRVALHRGLAVWLRYIIGIVEDAIDFGHEIVLPCGFVERVGESG